MLFEVVPDHFSLFLSVFGIFYLFQEVFLVSVGFVTFSSRFSFLTLNSVDLGCFRSLSVACRCSMCFCRFRLF